MSILVLSFLESSQEIVAGVPEFVEILSNIPATIYYTIDNTIPTLESNIYIQPIYFPVDGTSSFILSAFGIDGDGYSSLILTQIFSADQTKLTATRRFGDEGVVVDSFSNQTNIINGFNADSVAARFIDIPIEKLNIIHSEKGFDGIGEGTQIKVNIPDPKTTSNPYDDNFEETTTPQFAALFNPYALTITIDNRIHNEVSTLLRPWGSLENIYTEFNGKRLRSSADDACYVSGGFVRRFYSKEKNTMVSFYFDHNASKWIKNIQVLPNNIPSPYGQISGENSHVFQWIPRGKQGSGVF